MSNIVVIIIFQFFPCHYLLNEPLKIANACYHIHGRSDLKLALVYRVPFPPPKYLYLTIYLQNNSHGPLNIKNSSIINYHLLYNSSSCAKTVPFVNQNPSILIAVTIEIRLHKKFSVLASYFFVVKGRTQELVMLDDINGWMSLFIHFKISGSNVFEYSNITDQFNSNLLLPSYHTGDYVFCVITFNFFRYIIYELAITLKPNQSISHVLHMNYIVEESNENESVLATPFKSGGYLVDCTRNGQIKAEKVYFIHSGKKENFFYDLNFKDAFGDYEDYTFTEKSEKLIETAFDRSERPAVLNLVFVPYSQKGNLSLTKSNMLFIFKRKPYIRVCLRAKYIDIIVKYKKFGKLTASYGYTMRTKDFTKPYFKRRKLTPKLYSLCRKRRSQYNLSPELRPIKKYLLPY